MNESVKKRALFFIFISIFTDIMAFGMVIPLSPILAREFGADGFQVGLLISIYSIVQFLIAPYWGRLSDLIGRKPILLIGLLGVGFSHFWFACADTLLQLFISRALAGFFGANIVIGLAYIADITDLKDRSKNLGLIGAAFGLGFTVGPVLGFLFIYFGKYLELPFLSVGENLAAFGASFICVFNFVFSYFMLKDSRQILSQIKNHPQSYLSSFKKKDLFKRPSIGFIIQSLKNPQLAKILFMSFILWIGIAKIEPTLILLVQDDFEWTKRVAYVSFAYIGLLMVFSQGFLVRKLIPKFGEKVINQHGLFLFSLGLFLIGLSPLSFINYGQLPLGLLAAGVTLFGIGYSLSSTSLSGAMSLLSSKENQGSIFGINQSFTSFARITGPVIGGWLYRDFSHNSPFFTASVMGLVSLCLALWMGNEFPIIGKNKKREDKSSSNQDKLFDSIDKTQLKNLIEKRIHFMMFCEKDLSLSEYDFLSSINITYFQTKEDVLKALEGQEKASPIVLICKTGTLSKDITQKLRVEESYINAYYLEKGL